MSSVDYLKINESIYNESKNDFTYDHVLSQLGFGKYQLTLFMVVGLIGVIDGGENQITSLIKLLFVKKWNINKYEESMIGTITYAGYLFGSILSGPYGDIHGRRIPMMWAALSASIFCFLSAFSFNFYFYLIMRFLYVLSYGFMQPIGFSLLAENLSLESRGKALSMIGLNYALGEFIITLLAYLLLDDLQDISQNKWRFIVGFSSITSLILFLSCVFFIKESARFDLVIGRFQQAVQSINFMANQNTRLNFLNEQNLIQLEQWSIKQSQQEVTESAKFIQIFQKEYMKITPIIWFLWIGTTFIYYSTSFLFDQTLEKLNEKQPESPQNLFQIFISTLSDFPTPIFAMILQEMTFLGRKWVLSIVQIFIFVSSLLIYLEVWPGFIFYATFARTSSLLLFTINYTFTSEIYPTNLRSTGLASATAVGGLGCLFMPFIGVYIGDIGLFLPYLLNAIIAIIGAIVITFINYETKGKELN